jgi:hypothetical protein
MGSASAILKLQQDFEEANANDEEFFHLVISAFFRLNCLLIGSLLFCGW